MHKLALALLVAAPYLAADDTLPKADTILDHFVEVTGGKAAFEKHHTEIVHGNLEFVGRGLKGTIAIYQAVPNKNRAVIELEGIGKIESGSDGEVAWENNAMQGPRVKQGVERADAFRDATFNAALYWRKLYTKAETTGVETVGGHECYKVVLTPLEGNPTAHFYDKKSGFLIKTAAKRVTQMGEIEAETLVDDYRPEGDIVTAHKLTNKFAGQEIQITVEKVEFNAEIGKDRFDMPDEVKALQKKAETAAVKPAPAVATPAANGGKLTLYMSGKAISTENYTLEKADGKVQVDGSASAAIGPIKIDIEQFKVVTDGKFQPQDAVAKGKLGQVQMNVKLSLRTARPRTKWIPDKVRRKKMTPSRQTRWW